MSFDFHSLPLSFFIFPRGLYPLGCGRIISLEKSGEIRVRGSDHQPKMCRWLSIPSPPNLSNDVINFHFTYLDVPCHHGHVTLHDRNGGKKKTFCGADPPPITSLAATSQITLEINLEKGADVWGFDLQYNTESLGNQLIKINSHICY